MHRLVAAIAATVSVIALTAVIALNAKRSGAGPQAGAGSSPAEQVPQVINRSTASSVPCAVPMTWNVVRTDPGFELDSGDALEVVGAAAAAWESAVERELFQRVDSSASAVDLPVRFVFDERQERGLEQRRSEEALAVLDAELADRAASLEASLDSAEASRGEHERRVTDFERRLAAFNDSVRAWNEGGGAPDSVRVRLSARAESLDAEGDALQDEREAVNLRLEEIERARESYGERVEERNRRATELMDSFPPTSVESGLYREAVGRENGRVVSVEREIRIYRFPSRDDLFRIVAHEFGHALGLGHTDAPGALMNAEYAAGGPAADPNAVTSADVELLGERCPEL